MKQRGVAMKQRGVKQRGREQWWFLRFFMNDLKCLRANSERRCFLKHEFEKLSQKIWFIFVFLLQTAVGPLSGSVCLQQGCSTFALLPAASWGFYDLRPPVTSNDLRFWLAYVLLPYTEPSPLPHICLAVVVLNIPIHSRQRVFINGRELLHIF